MPFYPQQPRKSKFWKNNKSIWRCHHFTQMCTKNHSHMMYASLSMESKRHNFLSFWAIFYPFTPPNKPKNQDIKKWKKKQTNKQNTRRYHHFQGSNELILNYLWKNQGAEDAKAHSSREHFGASWIVFAMLFGICWIKK